MAKDAREWRIVQGSAREGVFVGCAGCLSVSLKSVPARVLGLGEWRCRPGQVTDGDKSIVAWSGMVSHSAGEKVGSQAGVQETASWRGRTIVMPVSGDVRTCTTGVLRGVCSSQLTQLQATTELSAVDNQKRGPPGSIQPSSKKTRCSCSQFGDAASREHNTMRGVLLQGSPSVAW
jgi:hypothetical protein